jgi:hypothetical protein
MNLEKDFILRHIIDYLLDFKLINERICHIRIKLRYYNLTLIPTHASTEERDEAAIVHWGKFYDVLPS